MLYNSRLSRREAGWICHLRGGRDSYKDARWRKDKAGDHKIRGVVCSHMRIRRSDGSFKEIENAIGIDLGIKSFRFWWKRRIRDSVSDGASEEGASCRGGRGIQITGWSSCEGCARYMMEWRGEETTHKRGFMITMHSGWSLEAWGGITIFHLKFQSWFLHYLQGWESWRLCSFNGKSVGLSNTHYICSQNTKAGSLLSHTPCHREVIIGQVLLTKQELNWMLLSEGERSHSNKKIWHRNHCWDGPSRRKQNEIQTFRQWRWGSHVYEHRHYDALHIEREDAC